MENDAAKVRLEYPLDIYHILIYACNRPTSADVVRKATFEIRKQQYVHHVRYQPNPYE